MKKLIILSVASLAVWSLMSCGNGANNQQAENPADSAQEINEVVKPVDEQSSQFAVDAANGSMMEVAMGKLAQEKGTNEKVKSFGAMMVNDHSKVGQEIKDLAAKKNITLPADISEDTKKHIDDLSKKSGKDFDKSYINMMIDDHEKDVKAFEKASNDVSDPDLKAWAGTTLPTLKMHLDSAKAAKDALK